MLSITDQLPYEEALAEIHAHVLDIVNEYNCVAAKAEEDTGEAFARMQVPYLYSSPKEEEMKKKDQEKQKVKEMAEARSQILALVEKYNKLANEVGGFNRIGMIDGDIYVDDNNIEAVEEDINRYAIYNRPETVFVSAPGAEGWFSSEFCYQS